MKTWLCILSTALALAACAAETSPDAPEFAAGQVIVRVTADTSSDDLDAALSQFDGAVVARPLMDAAGIWLISVPEGDEQRMVRELPKSPAIVTAELDQIMTIAPAGDPR